MGLPDSSTISLSSSYKNNLAFRKVGISRVMSFALFLIKTIILNYTFIGKSTYYAYILKSYLKRYCSIDDAKFKLNGTLIGEMSLK